MIFIIYLWRKYSNELREIGQRALGRWAIGFLFDGLLAITLRGMSPFCSLRGRCPITFDGSFSICLDLLRVLHLLLEERLRKKRKFNLSSKMISREGKTSSHLHALCAFVRHGSSSLLRRWIKFQRKAQFRQAVKRRTRQQTKWVYSKCQNKKLEARGRGSEDANKLDRKGCKICSNSQPQEK